MGLSVFQRLQEAVSASESIPDIIAEIDALLPEGYCVTRCDVAPAGEPSKQPAEDMSDWRNWREGDILTCVEPYFGEPFFKFGEQYTIKMINKERQSENFNRIGIELDSAGGSKNAWQPQFFRFHSRPAKVTE